MWSREWKAPSTRSSPRRNRVSRSPSPRGERFISTPRRMRKLDAANPFVESFDLFALGRQLPFVHAVRDCESARVVCDREVAQPSFPGGLRHGEHGIRAVAPKGMHLQIAPG